ncbi:MAG: YggT family protein [Limnochordaceae bacterium]|nr:YggT family protein [Limnochordaceae bacterium]
MVSTGDWLVHLYSLLILARVLISWIIPDPYHPITRALGQLTDPYLDLFRSLLPPIAMIDFSPMIALFVLEGGWALLRQVLLGL